MVFIILILFGSLDNSHKTIVPAVTLDTKPQSDGLNSQSKNLGRPSNQQDDRLSSNKSLHNGKYGSNRSDHDFKSNRLLMDKDDGESPDEEAMKF